jgi:hypothetical protein
MKVINPFFHAEEQRMKTRKLLAFFLVLSVTAACNMPSRPTPTQTVIPAVNVTLTALYQTAMAVLPSATPAPASATPTHQVATSTQAVVQPPPSTATKTAVPATAIPPTSVPPTQPAPTQASAPETGAPFLSKAPTIDGDWSEWKTVAREYTAQYVTYGKANRSGEDDLNASYYVGWDADYLYLAVKVRDDRYVQLAQGADIYKGDGIEVLLDTNRAGDLGNHTLSADDYQIGIAPGRPSIADGNPEVYRWFPASKAGSVSGVTVAALEEVGVYRVEAAIPWSTFGLKPAKGMRLGFVLSVSDDDKPGEQIQESMVSSVPNRRLTDPDTWGVLVLK